MIRTRFWKIGTIALLTGVPGCGSEATLESTEQPEVKPTEIPELGISMEGLGTAVSDCNDGSGVGGAGNYDSASKTMTMTLAGGSNVFSVVGTAVTVNGWSCYDEDGVALTTTNVKKMNITTSGSGDKIVFDLLPGSFGSIFSTTGGVTIESASGNDEFAVRGNTSANKMKAGEVSGDVYIEVSGDTKADIKLTGWTAPQTLSFLLGDGADTFEAFDVATISATHIDSAATALDPLSDDFPLIVYGGEGDDTIRGGLGDDTLYGNAGADTFLNADEDDGSDTFVGGAGTDTVSYASRTNQITADINPTGFVAVGVDLTTVTIDGAADYDLDVRIDDSADGAINGSDTTLTITATNSTSVADFVADLNADADATTAGLTFSVDPRNRLIAKGTVSFGVVAGQDETTLGLTVGVYTTTFGDNDDGESGEADDVQEDVENLIGGSHASGDTLTGNDGSNTITGGAGTDSISGGLAAASCSGDVDVLSGGDGNDTFLMGSVSDCGDEVNGGAGTDKVDYQYRTAALTITVDGSANDGLASEADNLKTDVEVIVGGTAADTITGGTGNETIHGGAGNDVISGGAGNDTLIGNAGDDTLNGAAGDDLFEAEGDDDVFANYATVTTDNKGSGADLMNGGTGTDKITYTGRSAAVSVTLCTDSAAATGAASTSPVPAVCTDSDGSAGSLTGTADLSSFDYSSSTGNLVLSVGSTPYTVALDTLANAAAVASAINGTATLSDSVTASIVSNNLVITLDVLSSTTAVTIDATTTDQVATDLGLTEGDSITNEGDKNINMEWLVGGGGADTLTGHSAGETIEGGASGDTVSGGAGDDTLYGDAGNDTLNGGDGNDAIFGGAGDDQAVGGNGDADICEYVSASDTTAAPLTCEFTP